MKWAAQDPVSPKETARNNAVYGIQNNRNPFIDYPGLEQLIWGDKKDVTFHYEGMSYILQIASGQQDADKWYMPDGRRLQGKPTQKGLYINNHRKVVVR